MTVADELLDRLAAAPLGDWVAERDALARELRADGRSEEADEVKQLRKPPAPVWAANQLARRRPQSIRRLVEAAERLRRAQASRREDYGAAREAERDALEAAVAEGRSLLAEAGADSDTMVQRLEATLRETAATEAGARTLQAGRLAEEPEAAGFDALLGAFGAGAPTAPAPKGRSTTRNRRAELDEARRAIEEVRARATAARKEARDAQRRADTARREAERAQEQADRAVAAADEAERELEAAKARLAQLRSR